MCGIVGYIGTQTAIEILLSGLEKLEYRGYDSAGLATIWEGELNCVRAKGKLYNLREKVEAVPNFSQIGIGHTRWATHGKPEEHNAHPHLDTNMRVAVVQNGIVENYRELREDLKNLGNEFRSETDTEVIPHLISEYLAKPDTSFLDAVRLAVNDLEGAYAIAAICADYPDEIIVVRQQAPLVIGFGQGEFFCASDTPALVPYTRAVLPLENGEMARLTPLGVEVYDLSGKRLKKAPRLLGWSPILVEKQGFKHFMLKEIYEEPGVVRAGLEAYLDSSWTADCQRSPVTLNLPEKFYKDLSHIEIVACGTSWHAGLIGKHLLEQIAGIPTTVDYASEYRYSPPPMMENTLTIGISQSGETADTLAALAMEQQRRNNQEEKYQPRLLGITNRPDSSLARLVPQIINTYAGIEIGVAATKSFIAQLIAFYCLTLDLAYRRQTLSGKQLEKMIAALRKLPEQIEQTLETQERYIENLAPDLADTKDFIFIGRGINFPIALEGALKLKEISYIHAEGYPAGEMKHGPIALLDSKVPVVTINMPGSVYEKVISNAQEAKARDARLIAVTSVGASNTGDLFEHILSVPDVDELLSPVLTLIPLQLLAYHIAARKGLDVDQPRNLAKSVTVE